MKQITVLFAAIIFVAQTGQAQIPQHIRQRLQDTVDYLKQTRNYKGISAAVSWKGYGEWKGAAGNSFSGKPLTDSMVIGIGSNTKSFLAAAILRLVETQQISLDDSIGKWLPSMPNINGSVTLSQLMHHTSGIYNYTENTALGDSINANPYRVWTKKELVTRFVKAPLFTPGKSWYYSNTNFLLAGMMAEKAGGMDVATLIRLMVLQPAGLYNTFFPPYETVTSERTYVWSNLGNGYLQGQMLPVEFYSVADAAGGMMSDAADNCKFWSSLFNGDIIQKSTLRDKMMDWVPVNSSMSYGLALMKERYFGNWTYSHNGSILGQLCDNLTDTINGITISVLSNQDSIINGLVVQGLYKILLQQNKLMAGITNADFSPLLVYPNPAGAALKISSPSTIDEASIYDLTGRLLSTLSEGRTDLEFNTSQLPRGVYFIRLRNEQGTYIRRFLKE